MNSLWKVLEPHHAALHALLLRLTLRQEIADELFHELLLKLHGSAGLGGSREPGAYARRAAINLAMDWRRSDRRRRAAPMPEDLAGGGTGPHEAAEQADEVARILDAIEALGELARDAFVLRYLQQESYERVGVILGKTPHQARGLCHAAVKQVRARLAQRQVVHERTQ